MFGLAPLVLWGVIALAVTGALGGLYLKGRSDGNAACLIDQQAQMAKIEAYVKKVRDRVERNLPLDDILRSDPFER